MASLQGREFLAGSPEFGQGFESYLFHELASYRDYAAHEPLSFWRSTSGFEVDFILGDHTAIEAKAKETISRQDLRSLVALAEEKRLRRYLCVSLEPRPRQLGLVRILPWREFLDALWENRYV